MTKYPLDYHYEKVSLIFHVLYFKKENVLVSLRIVFIKRFISLSKTPLNLIIRLYSVEYNINI